MAGESRRFLVDASMARCGGGFTYVATLVPQLARLAPNDHFRVLVRSARLADSLRSIPNVEVELLPEVGLLGRFRFTYLQAPRLAAKWKADLYYVIGEYAPLRTSCPVIASCQNFNVFIPIGRDWPIYQQFRLRLLRGLAQLSAWRCERIVFVSEVSARWIGHVLRLPHQRRATIHHGIDLEKWQPREETRPLRRPYILSVSSIYRYKNFVRLIEAWTELARRRPSTPDLVIVGDNQDVVYAQKMEAARVASGPLASRIHILGEVPHAEVRRYYAGAELFVFPSYLETFGLPLLEAMASETPIVATDMPVFREILDDAAFYADPREIGSIASAMEEALFREGAREALIKRGQERVQQFTAERSAARLLAVFRSVLAERRTEKAALPAGDMAWAPAPMGPMPGMPTTSRRDAIAR
jgi:glycosyltransferase involved in cell wall biosynthesis